MADWTSIPPWMSAHQVQGAGVLPLGLFQHPDGRQEVSFGAPQPLLDAYRAIGYATGQQQDPAAPEGYATEQALNRGAQGLAGTAMVGSLPARVPAGALRSGIPIASHEDPRTGHIEAWSPWGEVTGRRWTHRGEGPQISGSEVARPAQGQGHGAELYRAWGEQADEPFRSDIQVSPSARVMYELMYPKAGYRTLKNPDAIEVNGTMFGPLHGPPELQHVYRVEPPGQHTTRDFYSGGSGPMLPQGAPPSILGADPDRQRLIDYLDKVEGRVPYEQEMEIRKGLLG